MGYTHYWTTKETIKDEDWQRFASFTFSAIFVSPEIYVVNWSGERDTKPEISWTEISFNGSDEHAHETFAIFKKTEHKNGFCKTANKPYDTILVACLIAAKEFGVIQDWKSDGNEQDHIKGRELYKKTRAIAGWEV